MFNQTLHASVRLQIKFAAETFKKHCGQGARLDNETSARKLNGAEVLFVKRKWSWLQPKQKLETGDLSLGWADAGSFQGKDILNQSEVTEDHFSTEKQEARTEVQEAVSLL